MSPQKVTLKKPSQEMIQKVTSAGRQPPPPVPPAARPRVIEQPPASAANPFRKPPLDRGVKGDLPLPIGIPVELDLPGWDAQQPYTEVDRVSLDQASAQAIADANVPRPPVDPRTKKLKVDTVHAEDLPPGPQRDMITRKVNEAANQLQAQMQRAAPKFRDPTIQHAHEFATMHAAAAGDDIGVYDAAQQASPQLRGEIKRAVDAYKAPLPEPPPEEPQGMAPTTTGVLPAKTNCDHCNWPWDVPDGVVVTREDKLAFFACFLGGQPFTKVMRIFDGRVHVVFRTLTVREIDACYKQVLFEEKANEINGPMERYDRLNRYRLCLQLRQIATTDKVIHDLPDGLDEQANPSAKTVWNVEGIDHLRETALPTIEDHILRDVIRTENMHRVLTLVGNEFNRIVAKLEALTGSPDFLPETGVPS